MTNREATGKRAGNNYEYSISGNQEKYGIMIVKKARGHDSMKRSERIKK